MIRVIVMFRWIISRKFGWLLVSSIMLFVVSVSFFVFFDEVVLK